MWYQIARAGYYIVCAWLLFCMVFVPWATYYIWKKEKGR